MNNKEEKLNKTELGIYLHIPFCKKKCDYCDFISFPYSQAIELVEKYIETMEAEIDSYDLTSYNVTTIYMGGGTPSILPSKEIEKLLNKIKTKLEENKNETKWEDIEITIEVNPGTVDKNKLKTYKKSGVNRLSIGLQTTNNKLLKQIGRIHTYEEFLNTYQMAKEIGFQNCNVDLMLGLPNQTIQDLKQSLEKILELNPNHISVYSLIVEEGTPIERKLQKGELELPDEDTERQMYWYVKNTLELNGYEHYEISNFAKKGKQSKHNLNCWHQKEYIGIGISAHSYLNGVRYCNSSEIDKYIKNINKKEFNINDIINLCNGDTKILKKIDEVYEINEIQSLEDKKREYMLLGLRKLEGIKISSFKEKFIENPIYVYHKELEKLVSEKLIKVEGDWIKLTNKGLDLANLVWEKFV